MLSLKRGVGVVHSFNCTPAFVDMRLADALVSSLILMKRGKNDMRDRDYKVTADSEYVHKLW